MGRILIPVGHSSDFCILSDLFDPALASNAPIRVLAEATLRLNLAHVTRPRAQYFGGAVRIPIKLSMNKAVDSDP